MEVNRITGNQMERNREYEMETEAYVGISVPHEVIKFDEKRDSKPDPN